MVVPSPSVGSSPSRFCLCVGVISVVRYVLDPSDDV